MRYPQWSILAGMIAASVVGDAAQGRLTAADLLAPVPPPSAAVAPPAARLQPPDRSPFLRFFTDAEWYFSYGYSKQYWSSSDIHVSQPSLGNDFTIHGVQGHDDGFVQPSDIFSGNLFAPEYNLRFGRFINDARTIAVEVSLDHSKYATNTGQTLPVTGTIAGVPTNASVQLDNNAFFAEQLHNGANHLMVNAVYRLPLIGQTNETFSVAALAKVGAGVMLPHTSDTVLGNPNNVGDKTLSNAIGLTNGWWQVNGWTTGAELALRFVVWKPVYLEVSDKVAYARLTDLPAFMGTLQQSLWMNEFVVSLGVTYDGAAINATP
jgi:hypothetical protein